ncbi:PREDICTED: cleavage and polyadenylation specificity factor subunit 6-like [Rhagoletis zephyria]|uniref:cleavage and polyadenylation specificity factor subunit 6-like n=1 Tax=Rhagoletis zephyria TaxID=28612 RepID=UPI00081141A5|nr:PREDICTED: cleavage and polyadenylation specificity factor subunit 6-like [Rhagoletis zephyria]
MAEGAELDLYADDIGDEFSQEVEYTESDLYDDVITASSKSRTTGNNNAGNGASINSIKLEEAAPTTPSLYNGSAAQNQQSNHSNSSSNLLQSHTSSSSSEISSMNSSKKPCIYVGNLTWWTTDEDVTKALNSVGVNDVVEIKFFENRANGQSKGFCVVTLSLDSSIRVALEKLPKIELYGQAIAVTMCNRQNLNHFEMKSRKPGQNGQSNSGGSNNNGNNNSSGGGGSIGNSNYNNQNSMGSNRNYGNPSNQGMMLSTGSNRPPLLPGRPGTGLTGRPTNGPLLNSQPRLPQLPPHQQLGFGGANPQWTQLIQQNGPRNNQLHGSGPSLNPMLRMPQVGLGSVGQHALNVNALFGSQQSLVNPGDQFGNRFGGMNPFGGGHPGNDGFGRQVLDMGMPPMTDAEFEEILAKNKTLATNAVSRAVSDATSGDYHAACDTLATAISLISQSRVGKDERCQLVLASLKDTLQGLESKLTHGSGGGGERSRDRGSSRREKSRRERSRSREREYRERERSRDRERHYEDRYRKEDRDRDRHSERDSRRNRH